MSYPPNPQNPGYPQQPGYPPPGYQQGYAPPPPGYPAPAPATAPAPAPVQHGSIDDFYNQPAGGSGASLNAFFKNPDGSRKPPGTTIRAMVARDVTNADIQPQTDPVSKQQKQFRDGRPKFVMVVPLQVDPAQYPVFADGKAAWYVKGSVRNELSRAMSESGAPAGPPKGKAWVDITYTGRRNIPNLNPEETYTVKYYPPQPVAGVPTYQAQQGDGDSAPQAQANGGAPQTQPQPPGFPPQPQPTTGQPAPPIAPPGPPPAGQPGFTSGGPGVPNAATLGGPGGAAPPPVPYTQPQGPPPGYPPTGQQGGPAPLPPEMQAIIDKIQGGQPPQQG